MRRILLWGSLIVLLAACSLFPQKPYPPGTKAEVEVLCQENPDFPEIGCNVNLYAEPGKSKVVGSVSHGIPVEIVDSMDYDGVLYYQIRFGHIIKGWITADHIK